jgi:hypothetical protein
MLYRIVQRINNKRILIQHVVWVQCSNFVVPSVSLNTATTFIYPAMSNIKCTCPKPSGIVSCILLVPATVMQLHFNKLCQYNVRSTQF